ncbi:hypothetical protein BDN70DRAFT_884327 [Pholiota conissans]|uniref:Uncharacterized protein n=1 Tax=Pholiota conissans TaxID=109636 RepID=A0A9P5YUD2_9AGAR|nr:hypothetical protein BDN70DRAFT_884327 [Pholiota conissans]
MTDHRHKSNLSEIHEELASKYKSFDHLRPPQKYNTYLVLVPREPTHVSKPTTSRAAASSTDGIHTAFRTTAQNRIRMACPSTKYSALHNAKKC